MARKKGRNDFSDMFYQDNLNEQEKKKIASLYDKKETTADEILERFLEKGLSVKLTWSDYNEAHSCVVTPTDDSHPAFKTYYSTFHSDWRKALFVCDYLLKDRYDYGDWTKGAKSKPDNDW